MGPGQPGLGQLGLGQPGLPGLIGGQLGLGHLGLGLFTIIFAVSLAKLLPLGFTKHFHSPVSLFLVLLTTIPHLSGS